MVQWLRLIAPNAGSLDSIPGQELDPTGYDPVQLNKHKNKFKK